MRRKQSPPPADARLDGSNRDVGERGDLLVGNAPKVVQGDGLTVLLGKKRKCPRQIDPIDHFVLESGGRSRQNLVSGICHRFGQTTTLPKEIAAGVYTDP